MELTSKIVYCCDYALLVWLFFALLSIFCINISRKKMAKNNIVQNKLIGCCVPYWLCRLAWLSSDLCSWLIPGFLTRLYKILGRNFPSVAVWPGGQGAFSGLQIGEIRSYSYPGSSATTSLVWRSTVSCSAVQCSAVQCSALHCIAVHCRAIQCIAIHCSMG